MNSQWCGLRWGCWLDVMLELEILPLITNTRGQLGCGLAGAWHVIQHQLPQQKVHRSIFKIHLFFWPVRCCEYALLVAGHCKSFPRFPSSPEVQADASHLQLPVSSDMDLVPVVESLAQTELILYLMGEYLSSTSIKCPMHAYNNNSWLNISQMFISGQNSLHLWQKL